MKDFFIIEDKALRADIKTIKNHLRYGEPMDLSSEELEKLFFRISEGWQRERDFYEEKREELKKSMCECKVVSLRKYDNCTNSMCFCNAQAIAYETVSQLLKSKNKQKKICSNS